MTDVYASGPIEFTDNSSGKQLSIPLTAISFEDSIPPTWPDYQTYKPTVDALLKHLRATGIITPAPQASPKPAMVIKAKDPGSSGNNIQVTFSNPSATTTTFDAKVTETDTYTLLTPATIKTILGTGTASNTGKQPGLVYVSSTDDPDLPGVGVYSLSHDPATADIPKNTDSGTAFTVSAKSAGPEGAYTKVIIKDVDGTAKTFTLVATWEKSQTAIRPTALQTQFAYEITVEPPTAGGTPVVPAAGTITLSGGVDVKEVPAVPASATVTANP